jgi:hypothetical protein
MLEGKIGEIRACVGGCRRLRGLMEYVRAREKREETSRVGAEEPEEPIDYRYSPAQVLEGQSTLCSSAGWLVLGTDGWLR